MREESNKAKTKILKRDVSDEKNKKLLQSIVREVEKSGGGLV